MQGEYFCKRPPLKIFHPVIGVRPQGGSQMHCTSEADAKTSFYFNLRRWWMIGCCSVLYFMLQFSTLFCLCVNCISLVTMGTWHGRHMCQEFGKKERGNFRENWRNTETNLSPKYIPAMPCQWMFVGWSRDLNWPQCCCCRRGGVLSGVRVRVDLRGDPRRGVSSQGETNTLAPLTRFVHDIRKHDRRRKKHKIQTPFREA